MNDNFKYYLTASSVASLINFPLWRASTISQSGYKMNLHDYFYKTFMPPYRGLPSVLFGMTWARCAIFYGSDTSKKMLESIGINPMLSNTIPVFVCTSAVQVINMPLIKATVMMQNPSVSNNPSYSNVFKTCRHIVSKSGVLSLWHGLSAGILKTVPKYSISIISKDILEKKLPKVDESYKTYRLALKSMLSGIAGATLTNPFDVIRNEMFKNNRSLNNTIKYLIKEYNFSWLYRGIIPNIVSVAIPISSTIFLTEYLINNY